MDFGSGGGASPRLMARLSFWSAFFWRVEVGFRRAGIELTSQRRMI